MLQWLNNISNTILGAIIAFLAVFILGQYLVIVNLRGELISTKSKLDISNSNVAVQNVLIDANKVEYQKLYLESLDDIKIIKDKYNKLNESLDNFKEDKNETKCNNAFRLLNNYKY